MSEAILIRKGERLTLSQLLRNRTSKFVKPNDSGSSSGNQSETKEDLMAAIEKAFKESNE